MAVLVEEPSEPARDLRSSSAELGAGPSRERRAPDGRAREASAEEAALDRLLRRPARPWLPERWRDPRVVVAGVAVVVIGLGLFALFSGGTDGGGAALSIPRAGSGPEGVTIAPSPASGPADGAGAGAGAAAAGDERSSGSGPAGSVANTMPTGGAGSPVRITVHVAGAVAAPGLVTLDAAARIADGIAAAGGLRPDADVDRINLAAKLTDGTRIYVPIIGQEPPTGVVAANGTISGSGQSGETTAAGDAPVAPVDLNSATALELEALPGVGPATAAAIVAHRTANGPFIAVEELEDVRGIGPAKFDALVDLVAVG